MIRNNNRPNMLEAVFALAGLMFMPIFLSFTTTTRVAEAVEEHQTPFLTLVSMPLQNGNGSGNGNTENHFIIDKTQFKKAPEFTGITGFINTPNPIKLADLKGKIVLVHFWTYTCINCIHTVPYLNDWYQKYSNRGLVIIGVQTPEFSNEKNIDNVRMAVNQLQIKYPVILDNNYATWNAYGNNYWPRDYLVDNQGYIRYSHIGEGDYSQTEQMIQSLLAEGAIP